MAEADGLQVSAISQHLAMLSSFVSAFFALAWLAGSESVQRWLIHWIRPDVALASVAICASLFVHTFLRSWKHHLHAQRVCGFAGICVSAFHLENFIQRQHFSLVSLFNPTLLQEYVQMAPMAVCVTSLASMAAFLFAFPYQRAARRAAIRLTMLASLVAAGFLTSALSHWVSFQKANGERIMLPGASALILLISLSYLLSAPEAVQVRPYVSMHPSARLARSLLASCIAYILGLGVAGVGLQHSHLLNLQESTAFLASLAIGVGFFMLQSHLRVVERLFANETAHLQLVKEALEERERVYEVLEEDRARMRGVFDAAVNHCIITTGTDGLIDFFSTGAEQLLGYTTSEVVGRKSPLELHDRKELEMRAAQLGVSVSFDIFRAVPNLQQVDQREWTYITKSGERLPVMLTVTALRNSKGEITGYLGIGRDLRVEKKLQSERDAFLAIGQELLCAADPTTGVFKNVSPAFHSIFGYTSTDLIGSPFFDFIHPADQDETLRITGKLLEGIRVRRFENRWRGKDGTYRWISWDASILASDGLLYASGWDVTDEKARAEKIESLLLSEQHLIGIVSHDLRNPIGAISMGAQLIQRHKDRPDRVEKHAARILEGCTRAERMIYDILDFSRERHGGGINIHKEPVDLVELTAKNVEEMQLAHPQCAISFRAKGTATVFGDGGRISQVIGNLLGNACKYSPTGSPIEVEIERSQTDVVLAVRNGGDPIPKEVLPHLFKPMQRGTQKGEAQGNLGLGLYIVRQIVAKHGGSIDVESNVHTGTTFRIVLPNEEAKVAVD